MEEPPPPIPPTPVVARDAIRPMLPPMRTLLTNDELRERFALPAFEPPFEEFFATPQDVDFSPLCAAHGVSHTLVRDWAQFSALITAPEANGIRVLELRTDRKLDAARRKQWFAEIAAGL